jgi:hypothetical protein
MGEPNIPAWALDKLRQWITMRYTGSLELHFHRGGLGKIKERREYSEHDSATE